MEILILLGYAGWPQLQPGGAIQHRGYVIRRKYRPDNRTTIRIEGPGGRRVIITNSLGRVIKRGRIPLTIFVGLAGRYTIDVEGIGTITLYVRRGMDNIVRIGWSDDYCDDYPYTDLDIEEGRSYLLIREPYYRTILEVRKPAGYRVEVRRYGRIIRRGTVPARWSLPADGPYRVILKKGSITLWSRRLYLWDGYRHRLYVWPPHRAYIEPMPEDEFRKLITMLRNEQMESSRLDIVKTAAEENYFTSQQVKEIMETFDFEENRIRVAKLLYPRVVDRENFFVVLSALSYSSSRQELRRWIQQQEEDYYEDIPEDDDWREGWD